MHRLCYHTVFMLLLLAFVPVDSAFSQASRVDSLLVRVKNLPPDTTKVHVYGQLSQALNREDVESALQYAELGIELAEQLKYPYGRGLLLLRKAEATTRKGQFLDALKILREASNFFDARLHKREIATLHIDMSNNHQRVGNLGEALEDAQQAYQIAESLNDKVSLAAASNTIGRIYARLGNPSKALEYYNRNLAINSSRNDRRAQATTLNNLGSTYKDLGQYDKAISSLMASLKINLELENKPTLIYNYATLSEVYQLTDNLDSAYLYAQLSMDLSIELDDPYEIAYGYNDLGRVFLGKKEYDRAREYLQKAYTSSKAIMASEVVELAVQNLNRLYKETEEYDSAYRYLNELLAIREDVWFKDAKKISDLQLYFTNEQKQAEIDLLNKENALKESEIKREALIINVVGAGIVVAFILLALLYRNNRSQRKANTLLQQKNEDIEANRHELEVQKEQVQEALENIKLLSEIGQEITASLDVEHIIETVYQSVNKIMPAEGFGIGIYNEDTHAIEFPGFIEKGEILPHSSDSMEDPNRLSVLCFKDAKGIVINDYIQEYSKYISIVLPPNAGDIASSIIYYPLRTKKNTIGVITVQSFRKNAYSENHVNLLRNMAIYIAIALENAETYRRIEQSNAEIAEQKTLIERKNKELLQQTKQVQEAYQNIKLLSEIGIDITANLSVEKIISTVYQSINTLLKAEIFSIGLFSAEYNRLDFVGSMENDVQLPFHFDSLDDSERLSVVCFKGLREILINDIQKEYQRYVPYGAVPTPSEGELPESVIFLPLIGKKETLGIITVQSFQKNAYSDYDLNILRNLAIYAAIALENAESFQRIELINQEIAEQKEMIEEKNAVLARKNEEVERSFSNLQLLGQIGRDIIANLSVGKIIETVYENVNSLMDASVFWIGIYDKHRGALEFEGGIEKGESLPSFDINLEDDEKLAVICFRDQREIIINDFENEYSKYLSHKSPAVVGDVPSSIVYLPITTKNQRLGVLTIQSFKKDSYQNYEVTILRNLATYIVIALENAILYEHLEEEVADRTAEVVTQKEEIEKQKEEIERALLTVRQLSEIGQVLTGTLSVDTIIGQLYENVNRLMDAAAFGIGIYRPELNLIEFPGAQERGETLPTFTHSLSDKNRYSVWCFENQQEVIINDATVEYQKYVLETVPAVQGQNPISIVYMPLTLEEKVIGVITVQSFRKNAYNEYHINILRNLAVYAAIALANAEAYAKIESQNEKISRVSQKVQASINYGKRIQEAILPQRSIIRRSIPDSFILFRPRDIVSGDFFWFLERKGKTYIAAVDCTGHGVPGAFMSMIGNDLLNEIVNLLGVEEPDKILNALHIRIRRALKQDKNDNRDGMDLALCVIDHNRHVLQFAGAKNPLVYYDHIDGQMHMIKGDKMPIGGSQKEEAREFTLHELPLGEQMKSFYIFSDGYQDQFGGRNEDHPNGQKFMLRRLKETFLEMKDVPMRQQRDILTAKLDDWMAGEPQIDDVLVIGFRA